MLLSRIVSFVFRTLLLASHLGYKEKLRNARKTRGEKDLRFTINTLLYWFYLNYPPLKKLKTPITFFILKTKCFFLENSLFNTKKLLF
jgi:hypothetical protein